MQTMIQIKKKITIMLIICSIILSAFTANATSSDKSTAGDIDNLAYKQEIIIPIDTSLEIAKFQPIDIRINFINKCWAKNEDEHSVRVAYDDVSGLNELESQIYDLEHSDDTHISACSLVFLIPESANGKEKYYVLYDSSETDKPDYKDHLTLEDTHYYYEPISGQKIDFDYYKITEDGYINYIVVQKGELIGNPVSLAVAKFKPKSTVVETYNIDQLGTFDMRYGIVEEPGYIGSAWATEVNKNVLVDGNLMVRVRLESIAPKGDIKSDNIYTYYYCPSEIKRIYVDVNHEVLKTHEIENPKIFDGGYAGIVSIKSRSATIEKMNVGEILPLISLYSNDDIVKEYPVPINPSSIVEEEIFSTEADIDLGKKAWICLRNPETHKTHGLIMHSATGLIEGEEDGIQVKAFVKQNVKLPGLEVDSGNLFLLKNSYDKGREQITVLNEGFKVSFNAELITVEDDGYEKIDAESEIFQSLIKDVPVYRDGITDEEKDEVEKFSLKTKVHLAPSVPLGSLLCAALGKNIPYIYAELYKENSFKSSGAVGRLSLASIDLDFEDKNIFQLIKTAVGMFDWKNISLFKQISFPDLEAGTYVIKIYKENPILAKERQYIGFGVVDLRQDDTIDIYCRPQGTIKLSVTDQDDIGVENVNYLLQVNNATISDATSDINGTCLLEAPCFPIKPYVLKTFYQGFLIDEKEVTLGLKNRFIQLKETFSLEHYKLNLELKDLWGFAPAVDVNPTLTSNDMIDPIVISAEKTNEGMYEFTNLYPSDYILNMKYKSFEVAKEITINGDEELLLEFPAEYTLDIDIMDSYGNMISDGKIIISRNGQTEETQIKNDGTATVIVPPGEYEIIIQSDDEDIAKQNVDVRGNKKLDIVSSKDSVIHSIVFYLGVILALFSIFYLILFKKKTIVGMKLFVIALIIIAIVSPWWVVNGDDGTVTTRTNTLLIPSKIITTTSTSNVIGGDISQVPEEVPMVLTLISILLVVSCLLIFLSLFVKPRFRKTTIFISTFIFIILLMAVFVFYYAISELTSVSVGGFIGSGNLDITIPGVAENQTVLCSWGPGLGFYIGLISILFIVIISFFKRYKLVKEQFSIINC